MPELPEVEIVRMNLERWTAGRRVSAVELLPGARVTGDVTSLAGATLGPWRRRGKLLLGGTDRGLAVLSHLGMTGKWVADPAPGRQAVRVVVTLEGGGAGPTQLALVDPRRLGALWIVDEAAVEAHPRVRSLGPDLLDPALDGATLAQRARRGHLKGRLLDQGVIAGLGNIAVSETCFRAGVHPRAPCPDLPAEAWVTLLDAARAHVAFVLATETGDEVLYLSEGGSNPFLVYGREGEPCPRCGSPIVRVMLAGRPTFLCGVCQ